MRKHALLSAILLLPSSLIAAGPVSLEAVQPSLMQKAADFAAEHESPLAAAYNHLFALQGDKRVLQRKIEAQQIEVTRWVNDFLRQVDLVLSWGHGYVYTPDPKKLSAEQIAKAIYDRRLLLAPNEDDPLKIYVFWARAKKPDDNLDQYHSTEEDNVFTAQKALAALNRQMKDVDESIQETQELIIRLSR